MSVAVELNPGTQLSGRYVVVERIGPHPDRGRRVAPREAPRPSVLFNKRWEFAVAIEPVAVGANTIGWRPNVLPEKRRQFVLVERQRRPPLCADDDSPTSGKSVAELHHTAGANAGEIHDDESSAVQSLEALDVHES